MDHLKSDTRSISSHWKVHTLHPTHNCRMPLGTCEDNLCSSCEFLSHKDSGATVVSWSWKSWAEIEGERLGSMHLAHGTAAMGNVDTSVSSLRDQLWNFCESHSLILSLLTYKIGILILAIDFQGICEEKWLTEKKNVRICTLEVKKLTTVFSSLTLADWYSSNLGIYWMPISHLV